MKLKNEALQKLYDTFVYSVFGSDASEQSTIGKAFRECDEELSGSVTFEQIKNLQTSNDILERSNSVLLDANMDLAREKHKLEKDLNDLLSRAHNAEDEVEELKKKLDFQQNDIDGLRKNRDRKDEAIAKLAETFRLSSMCGDEYIKKLQDSARDIGYEQGQTDLWVKLQNVNDAELLELATCFPDVSCIDDILSWDLEDFLDAYKNWHKAQEQERIKHMRDHLIRFCLGRPCCDCPLHTDGFICGRGKGFIDMTYEELKKHYDKATDCSKRPWHGDATDEKTKFKPWTCTEPWTCTFEGTVNVEINRDLLNKVCGIDPDD